MTADPNIIFRGQTLDPCALAGGQVYLHEIQLVHDLREVVAGVVDAVNPWAIPQPSTRSKN
jgi:hypothetical protein